MPNWCSNSIVIKGNTETLQEIDNKFKGKYTDFEQHTVNKEDEENFINGLTSRYVVNELNGNKFTKTYYVEKESEGYSFNNILPLPFESSANWYDWRCDNWGTKWDIDKDNMYGQISEDGTELYYSFDTAWGPSLGISKEISRMYPDVIVEHLYEECGMCLAGKYVFQDGETISEDTCENNLEDYREFCAEELGYDYIGRCPNCGILIEDGEAENKFECPGCEAYLSIDNENKITVISDEL